MDRSDVVPIKPALSPLEILAPAGTLEVFATAVANGADAVYVGAPMLNARALAKHFSQAELAGMIDHAHRAGVKVYLAMNSLLKEKEIPQLLETLALLAGLQADALIIQDLGIARLARKYFPSLPLHASTLLAAHNSLAVRQYQEMGFQRIVLARELSLAEIGAIHRETAAELEVFVHGAMCFAYSGTCLFSSYLGGKSGLRGRCVQPCRRRYQWQGKGKGPPSAYLFSMNDLSAIDLLPELRAAGVVSLKIEGRMRSSSYVGAVVKAYRLMVDAPESERRETLAAAKELLAGAMGRKSTSGYFLNPQPPGAITPHHSGNIGIFLGKVEKGGEARAILTLREPLASGDRLRLHQEGSGERESFNLKELAVAGRPVARAEAGSKVSLLLPLPAKSGDSLFKVDGQERATGARQKAINPAHFNSLVAEILKKAKTDAILRELGGGKPRPASGKIQSGPSRPSRGGERSREGKVLPWWAKIDDLRLLPQLPLTPAPERVVAVLTRETFAQFQRLKRVAPGWQLTWALPVIIEEAHLEFYRQAVASLIHRGYSAWQIGHLGHLPLLAAAKSSGGGRSRPGPESGRRLAGAKTAAKLTIFADYTLNALNSQALLALAELGLQAGQVAIETDRDNLRQICQHPGLPRTGLTVYGAPPLFTSRLTPEFFQYGRTMVSPKGEELILLQKWGQTVAVSSQPFSLCSFLPELATMGVGYVVVDLTTVALRKESMATLVAELSGKSRGRQRLSTFNYQGTLY